MPDTVDRYELLQGMIQGRYDLIIEMIRGRDERLAIQAVEYERRLQDLNHENQRIMEILKLSVPREVFERVTNAMNDRTQLNTDYINNAKGRSLLERFIPWIISVAALIAMYFKK